MTGDTMSTPFIPGLPSLLSGSGVTEPQHNPVQTDLVRDEPHADSNAPPAEDSKMDEGLISSTVPSGDVSGAVEHKEPQSYNDEMVIDQSPVEEPSVSIEGAILDAPPSPPSLTSGLEALLGGLDPVPEIALSTSDPNQENGETHENAQDNGEAGNQEWEEDSSPYESSSDSSSSDDSEDDSEDEKDYQILGPEETARILMEMDGGSDDEGEGKGKGISSGQVRTKNELPEDIIPRPDIEIKPDMEVLELGTIEHLVGNTVVIKANTSGEYQVLDAGSVLCLQDRTVIAAVADIIATVREPRYTAGFATEDEIKSFGLEIGTKVYYPPALAKLGLTQTLRNDKGTDASNWHDEEVGDDEMEFSDDEKEAEYKRKQKAKKRVARGGRDGPPIGRGGHVDTTALAGSHGLKYDDDDDDGPYRPLSRPLGFGQSQVPQSGVENPGGFSGRGHNHRGGRGDGRGRGARGRGGRNRGGHSLPPRPQANQNFSSPPTQQYNPPPSPVPTVQAPGQPYANFPFPPNTQQPQQFPFPWPPQTSQGAPFFPPPPPQFANQQGANGMYFNPNFFAALQSQVHQQQNNQWQGEHRQQNSQWPGQGGHG
ncbi:Gar1/Naf1 RNA binding region-domain-containing protein [Xylariaceae sp. FL0255]|nr:Gar1/Naf1 RNA binding region-domain-containing protein [Xylariaceae sp. FL0255]